MSSDNSRPSVGQPPPGIPQGWHSPAPQQPKKPFFKRTWVIVGGAVVVLLVIVGVANSGGDSSTPAADQPASGGAASKKAAVPAAKKSEADKPVAQPVAKKWVKLVTLTGSADKQSDTLKVNGGKVRISYDFKDPTNTGSIVGAIYFLKEGTDVQEDGAIPEVMLSEPGKDTTTIRKGGGEYFLKVSGANTRYTVVVEEER